MTENAQKMRELLTKFTLHADELFDIFDTETLELMVSGCVMLNGMLKLEMEILTSVHVQAIVRDDLARLESNMKTIQATIKFKELKFEPFCRN